MTVNALSVVVRVSPGRLEDLKRVLAQVGADPATNPFIHLNESARTHLANWVIIEDPDNGPRLFFASNYDGELASYLDELVRVAPGLDHIFGCCEGYTGKAQFASFVRAHSFKAQTFFAGFPDETVANSGAKIALREQIEGQLDRLFELGADGAAAWQPLYDEARRVAPPPKRGIVKRLLSALYRPIHARFFAILISLARWYGRQRVDDHTVSVAVGLDQPSVPANLTDADHMTNLIEVRAGFRTVLRISLALMQFLASHGFPPGDLAGVNTIRFARWVLVDGGKRLLFQSRFDGTWENYMGDFVDKIDWGLDAIWGNCVGYPSAGMKDIDAFKRYIRDRQFAHIAIYEAFPSESVLTFLRDRAVVAGLAALDQSDTGTWLRTV